LNVSVPTSRPRVPPEIKLELGSRQDGFMARIKQIISGTAALASAAGDPSDDLKNLQSYLAGGEAMVVHARMGRTLVGFLVLDSTNGAAPFSWVDQRYRNKGLGERFYSFACINLARTTPEFRFHKDMLEEYAGVLRAAGLQPMLKDSFYTVHGVGAPAESNFEPLPAQAPAASVRAHLREGDKGPGAGGLVIDDGNWIGFSKHNARRLKLRFGQFPRLVEE
jgi:hypothetical protein